MSVGILASSKYHHASYSPVPCPFRVHSSPESQLASSLSWCAHHDFSDLRNCNMHVPCSVINTIANDPGFRISTALLYVRTGRDSRRRLSSQTSLPQIDSATPKILVNGASRWASKTANGWQLDADESDLGLLHLHRDRLAAAAEALGWYGIECLQHTTACLGLLRSKVQQHIQELTPVPANIVESRKIIIRVGKCGIVDITSAVIGQRTSVDRQNLLLHEWMPEDFDDPPNTDIPPSKVYLDTQPSRPSTLTSHKSNHRCIFTAARERLDIMPSIAPNVQEVILYK